MNTSLIAFAVFAASLTAGALLRRREDVERLVVKPVSLFLLYFIVPAAVLRSYATHGLSALKLYSLIALAVTLFSLLLWYFASSLVCGADAGCRGGLVFAAVFPNAIFLPLSLAPILGLDIDVIASYAAPIVLIHFTLGLGLVGGEPRRWLKLPVLVTAALVSGLALHPLHMQPTVAEALTIIRLAGVVSGYLAAFIVGASLPESIVHLDKFTLAVLVWRHLASPLLHHALAAVAGLTSVTLQTVMVEAVMPPATMNAVLAKHLGLDAPRVASAILVSTPIAVAEAILVHLLIH